MTDHRTPGAVPLPDVEDLPETRTPPLDDPGDEGPGGVPDLPEAPGDDNVELPDDPERDQHRRGPGRGTPNDDQPGRKDGSTERGGSEQV